MDGGQRTKGTAVETRSKGGTGSGVGDEQRGKTEEESWRGKVKRDGQAVELGWWRGDKRGQLVHVG